MHFPTVIGKQTIVAPLVDDDLKCDIASSSLNNKLSINTDQEVIEIIDLGFTKPCNPS